MTDQVNEAMTWTDDAEKWGNALNEAAWTFIETCPEKSTLLFNTAKGALRAAILRYAEVVSAVNPAPTPKDQPAVPSVPEDWVMVPREPTDEMCSAIEYGAASLICETRISERRDFLRKAIAAAQSPEAQPQASEAGQGVDLEQFRRPVTVWRALAEIGVFADYMPHHFRKPADEYSARVKEADRLLAIINAATPKDQPAQGVDGE